MLEFKISGQTLTRTDSFDPATDSEMYLQAKFKFEDADWDEKVRTALFRVDDAVYKAVINARTNICTVPAEVLAKDSSRYSRINGTKFFVSVIAEIDTTRITTNEVEIKLKASGYGEALTPDAPTQSEYQQLQTLYEEAFLECEQVVEESQKAREELVNAKNIFANAIKGKLEGYAVRADEVSPIEHNPIIKVHGKNLAKSFLNESTGTEYANCFYIDGDIQPNTTYTISFVGAADHAIYFNENITTVYTWLKCTGERQAVTITTKPDISSQYYIGKGYAIAKNNPGNTVVPNFAEVQVEKGDTATAYEAYINPSTIKLRKYGKNLAETFEANTTVNGLTFKTNSDGAISVSGTATQEVTIHNARFFLPAGTYTISGELPYSSHTNGDVYLYSRNALAVIARSYNGSNNRTFTLEEASEVDFYCRIASDRTCNGDKFHPQIEVGSVQTEYEKHKAVTEYKPSSNGTVTDLTSISDVMTLLTNTEGIIIECEYIKDTNKVIEKLVNAITALGGNVTI